MRVFAVLLLLSLEAFQGCNFQKETENICDASRKCQLSPAPLSPFRRLAYPCPQAAPSHTEQPGNIEHLRTFSSQERTE